MKNIILTLLTLLTLTTYSQKVDCVTHTLYSDIWEIVCDENLGIMVVPKGGGSFPIKTSDYVKDNIDLVKVESYLLESLNEFRADYGKPPVKESKWLTKISEDYASKLHNNFKHDYIERYWNKGISMSENIASMYLCQFSHLTEKDGDLNKIIADSFFDDYVVSESHTKMLLNENHTYYGFGLVRTGTKLSTVVRSSNVKKP
jgi:uncharacterized protein YkwD|tara:strand:+ start:2352 stop:2957 length:606 start_codon:yes stop_codon:yes gene_type:complete